MQINLPYTLWIAAYNNTFLLGYLSIEMLLSSDDTTRQVVPPLLDAFNRNGLAVFLAANLLTGLINISVQTMHASTGVSMGILIIYTGAVSAVAWYSKEYKIKL
jgi:phosphatidylinositol glycan class W